MNKWFVYILWGLLSWYPMMVLHEFGHIVSSYIGGADIHRVDLYPWQLSMTTRTGSSHPIFDVFAGLGFGGLFPLAFIWCGHFFKFFAFFCLLANSVYMFSGFFSHEGDVKELVDLGVSSYLIGTIGLLGIVCSFGLFYWLDYCREKDN